MSCILPEDHGALAKIYSNHQYGLRLVHHPKRKQKKICPRQDLNLGLPDFNLNLTTYTARLWDPLTQITIIIGALEKGTFHQTKVSQKSPLPESRKLLLTLFLYFQCSIQFKGVLFHLLLSYTTFIMNIEKSVLTKHGIFSAH